MLFPGGRLPLKIFEQRYIEMTKACLRDDRPFAVCLIREGREVGAPAVPEAIGCLATIDEWEMPQLGMFHLLARGGDRIRVRDTRADRLGLITGTIERLGTPEPTDAPDAACREVLRRLIERVGEFHFPQPIALDDAAWVAYRLAEVLPLDAQLKQEILELDEAADRFERLRAALVKAGIVAA